MLKCNQFVVLIVAESAIVVLLHLAAIDHLPKVCDIHGGSTFGIVVDDEWYSRLDKRELKTRIKTNVYLVHKRFLL